MSKQKLIWEFLEFLAKDCRYVCGSAITPKWLSSGSDSDLRYFREDDDVIDDLIKEFLSQGLEDTYHDRRIHRHQDGDDRIPKERIDPST